MGLALVRLMEDWAVTQSETRDAKIPGFGLNSAIGVPRPCLEFAPGMITHREKNTVNAGLTVLARAAR
jgi:hypothetical protein